MQRFPNKLSEILGEGFKADHFRPSEELLQLLGGMTLHRFNKILNNKGEDLTAVEKSGLEAWLFEITGIHFDIYQDGAEKFNRQLQSA